MCGIIGIVAKGPVNQALYDGLIVLQHRGQDAAGIMTCESGKFYMRKDNGMVRDVFHTRHMRDLRGNMGIGHARYPTAGCSTSAEAQPFYVNSPYGICLAHNGNLTNVDELKKEIFREEQRHINTDSDSEVLLNVFAHELQRGGKLRVSEEDIFQAVARVHERCRGGYAAVVMINGYGIVGFRDPFGIRPILFGKHETEQGAEYMIASESVAMNALGFEVLRDIAPGEAVLISEDGKLSARQCARNPVASPCIFEYVYLARPDSMIDGVSVYQARIRMGEKLAHKIERVWPDHDIDVVIPIPDTSRTAALQLCQVLNLPYREGFVKNRYIGRTFIMPGQVQRKKSVRQKLNAIGSEFKDKNVLLVDDSIVRGTTSQQIIQMARDAGARKVYFASAAPPVRYPNVYGIDMPSVHELIAHGRTEEEVARAIGADKLIYQDLEDLIEAVRAGNPGITRFDTSCFSGEYVTGGVSQAYLDHLEQIRCDASRLQRANSNAALDLYSSA
jgi:amidophosphoribosyltransferase